MTDDEIYKSEAYKARIEATMDGFKSQLSQNEYPINILQSAAERIAFWQMRAAANAKLLGEVGQAAQKAEKKLREPSPVPVERLNEALDLGWRLRDSENRPGLYPPTLLPPADSKPMKNQWAMEATRVIVYVPNWIGRESIEDISKPAPPKST